VPGNSLKEIRGIFLVIPSAYFMLHFQKLESFSLSVAGEYRSSGPENGKGVSEREIMAAKNAGRRFKKVH